MPPQRKAGGRRRPQRRDSGATLPPAAGAVTKHRCRFCRDHLRFVRRHVSPIRFGIPVRTEFYRCPACDSGYALDLGTGKWKRWLADED